MCPVVGTGPSSVTGLGKHSHAISLFAQVVVDASLSVHSIRKFSTECVHLGQHDGPMDDGQQDELIRLHKGTCRRSTLDS